MAARVKPRGYTAFQVTGMDRIGAKIKTRRNHLGFQQHDQKVPCIEN